MYDMLLRSARQHLMRNSTREGYVWVPHDSLMPALSGLWILVPKGGPLAQCGHGIRFPLTKAFVWAGVSRFPAGGLGTRAPSRCAHAGRQPEIQSTTTQQVGVIKTRGILSCRPTGQYLPLGSGPRMVTLPRWIPMRMQMPGLGSASAMSTVLLI